jgi:molecular chaperone GrpE
MEEMEKKEWEKKGKEKEEGQEDQKKKAKKDGKIIEELQHSVERKEETISALQEKILYMQADFENFKKLKVREREDTLKFGNEMLIKELLPVLDNLEMALDHASKTEDFKSIHEGVKLTLNELLKVLEKSGVSRVEALGKRFDPNLHEAFYQEERDDVEPETVIAEFQKGYLLNGRLIRPSRVTLSKKGDPK